MKLLKIGKFNKRHCYVFDKIPELEYEKIGNDYVGSVKDELGNIIFSQFLSYEKNGYLKAFAGRKIQLKMKDGSIKEIKDYWYDSGYYKSHGRFSNIAISTLSELQKCYVYCSMNMNTHILEKMIDDYLKQDKVYEYKELEKLIKSI